MQRLSGSSTRRNKTKTILYFCLHFPDGSPLFLYESRFLEVMCKKYRVIVAYFAEAHNSDKNVIVPENTTPVCLKDFPLPRYVPAFVRGALQSVIRIVRVAMLIRTVRPDLVNGNWISRSSGFYCAVANFHPFLVTSWGSDIQIEAKKSRILRALAKFTIHRADAVLVDGEATRKNALELGCNGAKIYSFPRGIDLERFRPLDSRATRKELGWSDKKIVISTRRHHPTCGVEYLIRAIPQILETEPDARFAIAGAGPLLDYHKSLGKKLRIEKNIRFLGWVDNAALPGLLNAAEVYVSTSFSDGTSSSMLEAMACGLPMVVTRIPGNDEWVTEGKNGLLVPPGDSVELARCIAEILRNEELRSRMSQANIRLAKARADWKINSLVLEKCLSDLMASRNFANHD
jgi:glycosyltransferase involved in cell wall biosynthesis